MIKLILKKRFEWPGVRLCLITGKHFATKISKSFIPKSTSSITPCHICPSLPILALSLLPSTDYKIWMARCEAVSHHREAFCYTRRKSCSNSCPVIPLWSKSAQYYNRRHLISWKPDLPLGSRASTLGCICHSTTIFRWIILHLTTSRFASLLSVNND